MQSWSSPFAFSNVLICFFAASFNSMSAISVIQNWQSKSSIDMALPLLVSGENTQNTKEILNCIGLLRQGLCTVLSTIVFLRLSSRDHHRPSQYPSLLYLIKRSDLLLCKSNFNRSFMSSHGRLFCFPQLAIHKIHRHEGCLLVSAKHTEKKNPSSLPLSRCKYWSTYTTFKALLWWVIELCDGSTIKHSTRNVHSFPSYEHLWQLSTITCLPPWTVVAEISKLCAKTDVKGAWRFPERR